jgi:hypothetical protein
MLNEISTFIDGHCIISDKLGNVLLNEHNAVHPSNMSRIIARAFAHERNCYIDRIALGDGGAYLDNGIVKLKAVNDGLTPQNTDFSTNWQADLYNTIYTEYVDDHSQLISTGIAAVSNYDLSSDENTPSPSAYFLNSGVVSATDGINSKVVISCIVNKKEPNNVIAGGKFVFNELGIFSASDMPISLKYQSTAQNKNNNNTKLEAPRLLTHLIFNPISKEFGDELNILYTLSIKINRSTSACG